MPGAEWVDEVVRGGAALIVFGGLFLAARVRFRQGRREGAGDVGLD